jgi:periplasmic protein TonB
MERAASKVIDRAVTAAAVLLAHAALAWIVIQARVYYLGSEATAQAVMASLIEQPRSRDLSPDPVPVTVKMQNVLHLQRLAPKIIDIPVEAPEPSPTAITEPMAASAPHPQQADTGTAADARQSSGQFGGGHQLTLLQRVVPRYPPLSLAMREEGGTGVQLRVDEKGRVSEVKIVRSSGSNRLNTAAVRAARKWKFAPTPAAAAPSGTWVETELRFVLYRFAYSRLGEGAADSVYDEQVKPGAADEATPGSQEALARFIADVSAGNFAAGLDHAARDELAKMRNALHEWGEVKSIHFTGTAGANRWMAYPVRQQSVEVSWNMFEVHHQHITSAWLIAVDRDGTIWNARASRAPWL